MCSSGSSGRVMMYMVTAVVVVGWYVRACGRGSSGEVMVVYMWFGCSGDWMVVYVYD